MPIIGKCNLSYGSKLGEKLPHRTHLKIKKQYYKRRYRLQDLEDSMDKLLEGLPNVLNAKEVSECLGISRSSTYNLFHSEDFPALHVNARLLVTKENFRKWLIVHTNKAGLTEEPPRQKKKEESQHLCYFIDERG